MSRPDSGTMTLLEQLDDTRIGQKIRTYGRVLALDPSTSHCLLEHHAHAVLADLSLCLAGPQRLPDVKDTIGLVAYVEAASSTNEVPPLNLPFKPKYTLNATLTLSAVMLLPANDLDLNLWRQAVQATNALAPMPFQTPPTL